MKTHVTSLKMSLSDAKKLLNNQIKEAEKVKNEIVTYRNDARKEKRQGLLDDENFYHDISRSLIERWSQQNVAILKHIVDTNELGLTEKLLFGFAETLVREDSVIPAR